MTTTYALAATEALGAFGREFPDIDRTVRPVHSEHVVEIAWTDGPTVTQVKAVLKSYLGDIKISAYRRISEDFHALLADDFEQITGEPFNPNNFYAFTFEDGRLVPSTHTTRGIHLLRHLSTQVSVDGERCVWSVKS